MLNRRQFLGTGAIGTAFLLPTGLGPLSRRAFAQAPPLPVPTPILGSTLTKFLDPLPIPAFLNQSGPNTYAVGMKETLVRAPPSNFVYPAAFPGTTVWSYYDKTVGAPDPNTYLGPTIVAFKGTPISVTWSNELPLRYLPTLDSASYSVVDVNLMGGNTLGPGAAVVHVHGGAQPASVDGLPWQWYAPGGSPTFNYPNNQPGSLIWYHDHSWGMTRLNVYAGLAGAYLIVDPATEPPNLPAIGGPFDVPLVLQDRMFDTNGQFYYPKNPQQGLGGPPSPWPGPSIPEFFGDTILVNGKVWPFLQVEARRYRFRMINGSQSRFYNLSFSGKKSPAFVQIGAEGGYLSAPAVSATLLIAPGERADVIVDFTGLAGLSFILSNSAKAPYPGGASVDPQTTAQVMQMRVVPPTSIDTTAIPTTLPGPQVPPVPVPPSPPITEIALFEQLALKQSVRLQLGPGGSLGGLSGGVPFDATVPPPDGTGTSLPIPAGWNIIRFINTTGDTHPMHTHLFMFHVIGRRAFNKAYVTPPGTPLPPSVLPFLQGQFAPANPNETGLKDTVMANPGEVTDVLAYVDPAAIGRTYVIHCHILEHEEKDMMIAFTVVGP